MTTISVVIPTRNRQELVRQTLSTVVTQDVDAQLEVIVVDEASSDGTADVVSSLDDARVLLLRNDTPVGADAARNQGADAASGEVLGFVDDDDLWSRDKVRLQLAEMRATGAPWSYGGAVMFSLDDDGALVRERVLRAPDPATAVASLPFQNVVPGGGSGVLVDTEAFWSVGGFQPPQMVADWDLWIRLAILAPPAVVDQPLMAYRRHGGGMSADPRAVLEAHAAIEERYTQLRRGQPLDWVAIYRWLRGWAELDGRWGTATSLAFRAWLLRHPGASKRLARALLRRSRPGLPAAWPQATETWVRATLGKD